MFSASCNCGAGCAAPAGAGIARSLAAGAGAAGGGSEDARAVLTGRSASSLSHLSVSSRNGADGGVNGALDARAGARFVL